MALLKDKENYFFRLKKEKQKLINNGFDPKPKLLSQRLGVPEKEVVDMEQRLDGWDISLDAPLKSDTETAQTDQKMIESESPEASIAKKEIELLLHNAVSEFRKQLNTRELDIFDERIFSNTPITLQELGNRDNISRERVRQIEKNIIKKMKELFKNKIPDFDSYSVPKSK